MKLKTTRKAIVDGSYRIVSAGYCDLQNLLRSIEPFAYTSGIYGWNFDAYEFDGLTICTGYRGMPGRRANGIAEFEDAARELNNSQLTMTYDEWREKSLALLHEFCAQA